jgi:hypothetical protein
MFLKQRPFFCLIFTFVQALPRLDDTLTETFRSDCVVQILHKLYIVFLHTINSRISPEPMCHWYALGYVKDAA